MSRLQFLWVRVRVRVTVYGKHSVRYFGPALWFQIDRKFTELKTVDQLKSDQEGTTRRALCFIYYCDVKLAKSKLYLIHGSHLIKTDSNRSFIPSIGAGALGATPPVSFSLIRKLVAVTKESDCSFKFT